MTETFFIFLGEFTYQSHSLNTDPCEFQETGKCHTSLAAQGWHQPVERRSWVQCAQTSDLPDWSERTAKHTSSPNRPDQNRE